MKRSFKAFLWGLCPGELLQQKRQRRPDEVRIVQLLQRSEDTEEDEPRNGRRPAGWKRRAFVFLAACLPTPLPQCLPPRSHTPCCFNKPRNLETSAFRL
ncbi:hypothetical protein KOW79_018587 [Hemibagrus wyckioides]|uniref:Uncharacterized protein n=1 Tax=Hemibagrus wyckioides TaxID=337641 RepID=A0A9D3NAV7_9TELE|nr:hypothetical protein KOW79_018587 [Hemibagrus wyckioides]